MWPRCPERTCDSSTPPGARGEASARGCRPNAHAPQRHQQSRRFHRPADLMAALPWNSSAGGPGPICGSATSVAPAPERWRRATKCATGRSPSGACGKLRATGASRRRTGVDQGNARAHPSSQARPLTNPPTRRLLAPPPKPGLYMCVSVFCVLCFNHPPRDTARNGKRAEGNPNRRPALSPPEPPSCADGE